MWSGCAQCSGKATHLPQLLEELAPGVPVAIPPTLFPLLGEQGQSLWLLFDSCHLWSMAGRADPLTQHGELETLLGDKEPGQ